MTKRIGIRQLREGLSRVVRRVERGDVVELTDRGRPVARLVPAGPLGGALGDLVVAGTVRPADSRGALPAPLNVRSRITSEKAIEILRGDR